MNNNVLDVKKKRKKKYTPNKRLTNGLTSKTSNSSICSPVPMNMTGLFVAATLHIYKTNKSKVSRSPDNTYSHTNTSIYNINFPNPLDDINFNFSCVYVIFYITRVVQI